MAISSLNPFVVDRAEAQTKIEETEKDENAPAAIAEDIRVRLTEQVGKMGEGPVKETYKKTLQSFKAQIEQFNPNNPANSADREALQALQGENPGVWEAAYFEGWVQGLNQLVSVADVYAQETTLNKTQQFILFEYLKVLGGEVDPSKVTDTIRKDMEDNGSFTQPQHREKVEQVLVNAAKERLTPFREYAKQFKGISSAKAREIVHKEVVERKTALSDLVEVIENANLEAVGETVYQDTRSLKREVVVLPTEADNENERKALFSKVFDNWDAKTAGRVLDTTNGEKLTDLKWYGPKRFNPETDHTNKRQKGRVRIEEGGGKQRIAEVETTRLTLYTHEFLSKANGLEYGTAVKSDPIIRTEAFDMEFNTVNSTGLMLDLMKIPPAREIKSGTETVSYQIPVMHRGKPTWMTISKKQHDKLESNLTRTKTDFEALGFKYDPKVALEQLKFKDKEKPTTPKTEIKESRGIRTAGSMATDWVQHERANIQIDMMAEEALIHLESYAVITKSDKALGDFTKTVNEKRSLAKNAIDEYALNAGRTEVYEEEVLKKLGSITGLIQGSQEWHRLYALEMQLVVKRYEIQGRNIRNYHQNLTVLYQAFSENTHTDPPKLIYEERNRLLQMLTEMDRMVSGNYNLSEADNKFIEDIRAEISKKPIDEAKKARTELASKLESKIVGGGITGPDGEPFIYGIREPITDIEVVRRTQPIFKKYIADAESETNPIDPNETRVHIINNMEHIGLQETSLNETSLVFVDMPVDGKRKRIWMYLPNKEMKAFSDTFERGNQMDRDFIPEIAMQVAHVDYPQYRTNELRKTTIVKI